MSKHTASIRPDGADKRLNAIRGCLIGGAAGDALGYPVEFMGEKMLFSEYGPRGIRQYKLGEASGKALISDDTQMTLFTANAILYGQTRQTLSGDEGTPHLYMAQCYGDWYQTQSLPFQLFQKTKRQEGGAVSWLTDVPELFSRRAPGNTCMNALYELKHQRPVHNNSKGCGGVMRVAPLGLSSFISDAEEAAMEGDAFARITHQHPLGYMPGAMLADLIYRIVHLRGQKSLMTLVTESRNAIDRMYSVQPCIQELMELVDWAMVCAANDQPDLENIHSLGEGWVGEEALAIALYCALRHENDFSAGICAAVNHKGDSDSTGAIAGNILGAWLGFDAIDDQWKTDLELYDVIMEMADDLYQGCRLDEQGHCEPAWERKYVRATWQEEDLSPVFFWHEYHEYGEFSHWYPAGFEMDGIPYEHVEQYMMSRKAALFHDTASYTAILGTSSPAECKRLGRLVKPFDPDLWAEVAPGVVKEANRAKFLQNPELLELLLSTKGRTIAEASPLDDIWGIGIDQYDAASLQESEWPGQNLLGRILMALRDELSADR